LKTKVIFDISIIADQYKKNQTGIFRVADELFRNFLKNDRLHLFYSVYGQSLRKSTNEDLREYFSDNGFAVEKANTRKRIKFIPFRKEKLFRRLYDKLGITNYKVHNEEVVLRSAEIFHSPYFPIPETLRKYEHLKKVVTIHDLIPTLFPEYNSDTELQKEIIGSIADKDYVICVSENTKKDLLVCAPHLRPENIFVSLLAASPEIFYEDKNPEKFNIIKKKYNIPDRYFLSVSTLEPRKNIDHIIKCFLETIKQNNIDDLSLVLVGSKGWDYDKIFEAYENSDILKNKIIITGRIPDEDMASVYSNADAFFYLSFYEGFGLPPLEAMQCGIPVVVSNTSSLPEVVGNAGFLLDAENVQELCVVMYNLYTNEPLREKYSVLSLNRAKLFTWEKTVQQHIEIYRKILYSSDNFIN